MQHYTYVSSLVPSLIERIQNCGYNATLRLHKLSRVLKDMGHET